MEINFTEKESRLENSFRKINILILSSKKKKRRIIPRAKIHIVQFYNLIREIFVPSN